MSVEKKLFNLGKRGALLTNLTLIAGAAFGCVGAEQINGQNESPDCAHWPIDGHVTSKYGPEHPLGIDIQPDHDLKAPIGAPASGKIIFATDPSDSGIGSYGNYVVMLTDDEKYEFLFAHMSKVEVSAGQAVTLDEEIGKTGSTGYSTGSHVHFEAIDEGVRVDPLDVLCKK